jgi:hypothetical protein
MHFKFHPSHVLSKILIVLPNRQKSHFIAHALQSMDLQGHYASSRSGSRNLNCTADYKLKILSIKLKTFSDKVHRMSGNLFICKKKFFFLNILIWLSQKVKRNGLRSGFEHWCLQLHIPYDYKVLYNYKNVKCSVPYTKVQQILLPLPHQKM